MEQVFYEQVPLLAATATTTAVLVLLDLSAEPRASCEKTAVSPLLGH